MSATTVKDIRDLIDRLEDGGLAVPEFCATFERIWNFEVDKNAVSPAAFEHLDFLFDEVTLFCALPREDWEYPAYRDEAQIRAVATTARSSIDSD